jgi:hypothetical protein
MTEILFARQTDVTTITNGVVRFDIPQSLTSLQMNQAQTNIIQNSLGSWWSDVGTMTPNPVVRIRDRLFVDDGALAGTALGSSTSCIGNTRAGAVFNTLGDGWAKASCYASLYVVPSNGLDGIIAQTVTSLQTGVVGANSNLGVAILGMGVSDNTVQSETAWGAYFDGIRTADLGWAYGVEIQISNTQSVQPNTIYGTNNKQTIGLQIDAGAAASLNDNNPSCGLLFIHNSSGGGTAAFDRGVVFGNNSVADQGGGVFNAVNFPTNYRVNWWRNNSNADQLQAYITANDTTVNDPTMSLVFGSSAAVTLTAQSFAVTPTNSLANGTQVLNITATQPASPVGAQSAVNFTIASNGSAAINNRAVSISYNAGYTGPNRTDASFSSNAVAGTGTTLIPASGANTFVGNDGGLGSSASTTTGYNVGFVGIAATGAVNAGLLGLAQIPKNSATNIGVVGSAINTGTSPVQIGGWFSLNQTTLPSVSAALIADNASQSNPIALFMAAGATKFSVDQYGNPTLKVYTVTTLPTAAGAGAIALVSDATSNVVLGAGGGTAYCLAAWNGSAWVAL